MKKLLLAIVALSGFFFGASAQEQEGVTFGVRGGMNFATLSGSIVQDGWLRSMGQGGVVMDIPVYDFLYLQTGLYYMPKGKWSEDWDDDFRMKIHYVEMPILLSAKMPLAGDLKGHLHFGPYMSYAVDGKWTMMIQNVDTHIKYFEDERCKDLFWHFDVGLTFGSSLSYGRYSLGVFYDLGLMNMVDRFIRRGQSYTFLFPNDAAIDLRNRSFYFSVGINF